jgi:hypothetical protein
MEESELPASKRNQKSILVTDDYLIEIVESLANLTEAWKVKVKNGTLKLNLAVQIGSKLNHKDQKRFMEFCEDVHFPEKYTGKVLRL